MTYFLIDKIQMNFMKILFSLTWKSKTSQEIIALMAYVPYLCKKIIITLM